MKNLVILIILSSFTAQAIVNGKKANKQEKLKFDAVTYIDNNGFECTGVIIAPNLVLTAAHCVLELDKKTKPVLPVKVSNRIKVKIKYKKKKRNKNKYKLKTKTIYAKRVIPHSYFATDYPTNTSKKYGHYDLALIELKESVNKLKYPKINSKLDSGNFNIHIAGHGARKLSNRNTSSTSSLYFANRMSNYDNGYNMISYSVTKKSPQMYKGDSGSAMFTSSMEIIGIAHGVTKISSENRKNYYVNLSSNPSIDFFEHLNDLGYKVNY